MVGNMLDLLETSIETYNRITQEDDRIRKLVEGKVRVVEIQLEDDVAYNFYLEGDRAHSLVEGRANAETDIVIKSSENVLRDIAGGRMSPMKAMATGKLVIKAPFTDLLLLRKVFSSG